MRASGGESVQIPSFSLLPLPRIDLLSRWKSNSWSLRFEADIRTDGNRGNSKITSLYDEVGDRSHSTMLPSVLRAHAIHVRFVIPGRKRDVGDESAFHNNGHRRLRSRPVRVSELTRTSSGMTQAGNPERSSGQQSQFADCVSACFSQARKRL
jgi:hypothetical protein